MIYKKEELDKFSQMAVSDMSIHTGRNIEIYRSTDLELTTRYFSARNEGKDPALGYFEVVVFPYHYNMKSEYIRYPFSDVFVELYGGFGSCRNDMSQGRFRDIVYESMYPYKYNDKLQASQLLIFKHQDNMMIQLGRHSGDFNFLKKVAQLVDKDYPHPVRPGMDLVDEVLKRKFIPLPDKRRVESAYKTADGNFILIDASVYNYDYDSLRCHYGNQNDGMGIATISDFVRYRDGGTTTFTFTLGDVSRKYFSPSPFKKDVPATCDGIEMEPMTDVTISILVEHLGIDLADEVEL